MVIFFSDGDICFVVIAFFFHLIISTFGGMCETRAIMLRHRSTEVSLDSSQQRAQRFYLNDINDMCTTENISDQGIRKFEGIDCELICRDKGSSCST